MVSNQNKKLRLKSSEIDFKDRLVSIQRVTKVTKGGRNFSFSAVVVVGDEKGIVGHGLGKANEVTSAISKGVDDAKKNIIKVPVINGTLPHKIVGKYSGAEVYIQPASPGTGIIAGGAMRAVFDSVGVTDILAKSKGSSNPHSVVKATIDALSRVRDARQVAQQRGISMNKVFNG
jgi:small subunit ribosomal protein S5